MSSDIVSLDSEQRPMLWLEIAYDLAMQERPKPKPILQVSEAEYKDSSGKQKKTRKKTISYQREPTVKWLQEKYRLDAKSALRLITNPKFIEFLHGMQKAIAQVNFNQKAFDILDEVMETGMDKHRLAAIKLAAELLGYKQSGGFNLNFNFDSIIRKADSGEGPVIDTEAYPGF